jgi:hypothetical protein
MELFAIVFFIFLVAILLACVTIPLLAISRLVRLLRNSFAKLFKKAHPRKA